MLYLQHQLNNLIKPEWYTLEQDFQLAIQIEAAEFCDQLGWPWWKMQPMNVDQAKLELIDIWHFSMAIIAREALNELPQLAAADLNAWLADPLVMAHAADICSACEADVDREKYGVDMKSQLIAIAKTITYFVLGDGTLALRQMCLAMEILGMESMFQSFVAKNSLNIFRQLNGYKNGSYIKTWNGAEDNVYLAVIMEEWDMQNIDWISHKLATKYREVLEDACR